MALFSSALAGPPSAFAQTAPKLASVTPADQATGVALSAKLVFVFDQDMNTQTPIVPSFPPFLVGNVEFTSADQAPFFSCTWGADGKTLTCSALNDLPSNTAINWKLNPAGNMFPIASKAGAPLAEISGGFTTGGKPAGGGEDETCSNGSDGNVPTTWGSYSISKNYRYAQTSSTDPQPEADSAFNFSAFVRAPQNGPQVTAASVTLPDGSQDPLTSSFGSWLIFDNFATEAALDTAYPAGSYTMRFTQTGQPERVIAMNILAAPVPTPKIANFVESQAINAAQDFTLRWNPFTGAGANDFLAVSIFDERGRILFSAPNLCIPRELPVTATSVVIPANKLPASGTLSASLTFFRGFYDSTNTIPEMAGFGSLVKTTQFAVKTGTGGGTGTPARFTGYRLLPNGNPELTLSGTAGQSQTIQRSSTVAPANWTEAGTINISPVGTAVFEDKQIGKAFPLFYRAIAN